MKATLSKKTALLMVGACAALIIKSACGQLAPNLGISQSNGIPMVSVTGIVGSNYAIQYAPALTRTAAWQALVPLTLTNTPQMIPDSTIGTNQQRFYRAYLVTNSPPPGMPALPAPPAAQPSVHINVTNYGVVGDGVTLNRTALQNALNAAGSAPGGATVDILTPGTYVTGSIELPSGVWLNIGTNVVLQGSDVATNYLLPNGAYFTNRWNGLDQATYGSLIYAENATNIAVVGQGTINGGPTVGSNRSPRGPLAIEFRYCTNVYIHGLNVDNHNVWTIHPTYCTDVTMSDITIVSDGVNSDGIDPDSCTRALIDTCSFSDGDDDIAIKSGIDMQGYLLGLPSQDITIQNCTFVQSASVSGGLCVGSEVSGSIYRVLVTSNVFNADSIGSIYIKSRSGRAGVVSDITISNNIFNGTRVFFIDAFYSSTPPSDPVVDTNGNLVPTLFSNVVLEDATLDANGVIGSLNGDSNMPIDDVVFANLSGSATGGISMSNADNVTLCSINVAGSGLSVPACITSVAAPVFSPGPGAYANSQSVTMTCSTPGASINYTTDGSAPGIGAGTLYSGAILLTTNTTLSAIAYGYGSNGFDSSSITSGFYTISGTPPPYMTQQPVNQTNYATQAATFNASAGGISPLHYQWRVESGGVYVNLSPGGQFSGVTNTTLSISSLVANNATNYDVVVSNSGGSVTSAVATLTVLNATPSMTTQPASLTNYVGQTTAFTVTAAGLPPLSYQWQVESNGVYANLSAGGQFSGVTNTTLSISSLTTNNATNYEVVVTNSLGSVTSAVAKLTVLPASYQAVILADTPVSYWPMQETTGPTIHDIVSGYNGTLMTSTDGTSLGLGQHTAFANAGSGSSDGATYLLGGPGGLTGVPGDTAIYFTNLNTSVNNSQIVVPYNTAIDPESAFTAEAWINVPTYPIGYTNTAFQTVLGLEAFGTAENGWWMAFETDSSGSEGNVQFTVAQYPGFWLANPPTSTSSLAGTWVHAVEVYTGSNSNLVCYTNGVVMATVAMATYYESENLYGTHKLPFIIGSYSSPGGANGGYKGGGTLADGYERGNFWHGGVSHVAIYNYGLASSQVAYHYSIGR